MRCAEKGFGITTGIKIYDNATRPVLLKWVVDFVVPLANHVQIDLISLKYIIYLPSWCITFISQLEHNQFLRAVFYFSSVNQSTPTF